MKTSTEAPQTFALLYQVNDGDILPVPNAPNALTRMQGRDALRECYAAAKAAGYTVERYDFDGNFVVRRNSDVARVWIEQVSGAWQESA